MRVLQVGVEYTLDTSDKPDPKEFHVKFCHKSGDGSFVNGITSEEVMKMMINRYQHLVHKDPSTENIQALLFLKRAYEAINSRNFTKIKNRNGYQGNGVSVQDGKPAS